MSESRRLRQHGPWGWISEPEKPSRCDQYRDALEAWAAWWNNVGREHYRFHIVPPITMTGEALACTACKGVGWYEASDSPVDRCQVCGRKLLP